MEPNYTGFWAEPQQARARGTSGLAIAALILGVIGLWPLALIFAIIALVQIGRSGQGGKGLAITGLVFALLWAVAQVFFVVLVVNTAKKVINQPVKVGKQAAAIQLRRGDCFDMVAGGSTSTTIRACNQPHDGQVVVTFTLQDSSYPGDAKARQESQRGCTQQVNALFKTHKPNRALQLYTLYPKQIGWTIGEHTVRCALLSGDGTKISSSLLKH
jgi:hypothetical protein